MKPLPLEEFEKKVDVLVRAGVLNRTTNNKVEMSKEFKRRWRYNLKRMTGSLKEMAERSIVLTLIELLKRDVEMEELTHYYFIIVSMCSHIYEKAIEKFGVEGVDKKIEEGMKKFQKAGVGQPP